MAEGFTATLPSIGAWLGIAAELPEVTVTGVSTDSRSLEAGSLFVALRGERHDGHDHIPQALERGAAALLVDHPLDLALPLLVVPDTRLALGRIASAWRQAVGTPLVAVTGSNGKTTVKQMLAAILGTAGPALATRGNLNNDIGVPHTLLRLRPSHRHGVIEMGANHPGEIAYLVDLVRPQVGVVTNAAPAHLAGFGSLEGVARAKGELFQGLPDTATAIINADDRFADLWRGMAGARPVLTFGLREADVRGEWTAEGIGSRVVVHARSGGWPLRLPVPGEHNVQNALAAFAAALALGLEPAHIVAGLEALEPPPGRLQSRRGLRGAAILDDTYNANPASFQAAIEVLAKRPGRRLLVMGDMGELGAGEAELHGQVGLTARRAGLDGLYATGRLSAHAAEAFGANGFFFADREALVRTLRCELAEEVTILVKGSRSMQMERVVEGLLNDGGAA